jgi:multidrug efflux pump subunit AcrB
MRRILADVPSVTLSRSTIATSAPEFSLRVDEAKARAVGLELADISRQFEAALEGSIGGSMLEGPEILPVRVRLDASQNASAEQLQDFLILPPNAQAIAATGRLPAIPLSTLASVELAPGTTDITRLNGERVNTVQAFTLRSVLPEEALRDAQNALEAAGFALPVGYRLQLGGDSDARADTLGNLLASLGLIVTLSIAAIVLTFNSFRLTLVALVVSVLSAGLSILSLAVFQYPFGINAIIGVIGSIGVSINAAIIIMTGLRDNTMARAGNHDAMIEVLMGSSRHILSTTITTFGGFLPLILAGGGFWPPFAMSVAGGVMLSTVVSFYFTPPMFALLYAGKRASQPQSEPLQIRKDTRVLQAAE